MLVAILLACRESPGPGPASHPADLPVTIGPVGARLGYDDLTCAAEGVTAPVFRWIADGVEVPGDDGLSPGDTIAAHRTRLGRVWRCEVTDGDLTGAAEVVPEVPRTNLLVLLADDIGREKLATEGIGLGPFPATPNLDALAAVSVRFTEAWSTPLCSPTRATMMTGRLPRQHGIGDILNPADPWPLPDDEVFFPQVLAAAEEPVESALVGKWHLNVRDVGSGAQQPGVAGFSFWRATNGNLATHFSPGPHTNYGLWEYNVDGTLSSNTEYATGVVVRDAIDALARLEPPWFLFVALHAAHDPFHVPPEEFRYSQPSLAPGKREKAALMIESADIAVGRILDALTEEQRAETTIVFLADNGSMYTVAGPPFDRNSSKGSPFQGGVNVPFWVSGPLVAEPGSVSRGLVHTADLFDTALALAGVLPAEADALVGAEPHLRFTESFLPYLSRPDRPTIREVMYTEKFLDNGAPPYRLHACAVTDGRFKVVRGDREGLVDHFLFDLEADPFEDQDLLAAGPEGEAEAAWDRLSEALATFDEELVFEY